MVCIPSQDRVNTAPAGGSGVATGEGKITAQAARMASAQLAKMKVGRSDPVILEVLNA
jgi:hypothetical protein